MNNLYTAHNQWRNRPDDERFWSLQEMRDEAVTQREASVTTDLEHGENLARVDTRGSEELHLVTTGHQHFRLNNWSFGQLCNTVRAPAGYLVGLDSPDLVADCLTRGLKNMDENERSSGLSLLHQEGMLRAVKTQRYARIWDADILDRIIPLVEEHGWKAPPARPAHGNSPKNRLATAEDITRSTWVKQGDLIGPAGFYRGDRDMFAFLVNDDSRIDDGSDGGISRGFIVQNSEVGNCSFIYTEFGFKNTCGNHIIWGVSDVKEIKLRHIGADLDERAFGELSCRLVEYANSSTEDDRLMVAKAKSFILGKDKEAVLDFLFGKRLMSRSLAKQSFDACIRYEHDLDPYSAWGIVNGLTRISQKEVHADKRMELDKVGGTILRKVAVSA